MSISTRETLSQCLSKLTYNGEEIQLSTMPVCRYHGEEIELPEQSRSNLYMGIGLWSGKSLTTGLPVDIMHMLLSAATMRLLIKQANPDMPSKVILLIADSMAVREGARAEEVATLVQIYKKSLQPLLDLLKLGEDAKFLLSSDLEKSNNYQQILASVEKSQTMLNLKRRDSSRYAYTCAQTAITRYMNVHKKVGIKVGWKYTPPKIGMDEAEFDRLYEETWKEIRQAESLVAAPEQSTLQYLYTRAGMKQLARQGIIEGCPYTACAGEQRYIIQTKEEVDIKTISKVQTKVAKQWEKVIKACTGLITTHLVSPSLLPQSDINDNHLSGTVYRMLNRWVNAPVKSKEEPPLPEEKEPMRSPKPVAIPLPQPPQQPSKTVARCNNLVEKTHA